MSKKMRRAAMHTHTHTHSKPPTCSNPLSPHSSSACQAALCSGCRTQYADASTHVRNSSYSHFQNTPPLLVQILPLNRSDRNCRLSPTALLRLCLCPIISALPCLLGAPVRRTYMLHIHAPRPNPHVSISCLALLRHISFHVCLCLSGLSRTSLPPAIYIDALRSRSLLRFRQISRLQSHTIFPVCALTPGTLAFIFVGLSFHCCVDC